uniref:Putative secreted protein n=1 Tax=Ixodes ricinus TaxID=34613 RepID=A0A6B0U8F2_IXORI
MQVLLLKGLVFIAILGPLQSICYNLQLVPSVYCPQFPGVCRLPVVTIRGCPLPKTPSKFSRASVRPDTGQPAISQFFWKECGA